jgi:Zn-dependent protease
VLFTEVVSVILVMFSVVLHEVAHGWVAWKLGDPTAKQAGRLTLNPLKHLDPFGSVLLPLILAIVGGPVFAFAIPVPYNPNNLRNPRRDEVLVALAGPACNLLQAVLGAAVFRFLFRTQAVDGSVTYLVLSALATYVYVNLTLMFFNLIPLPPLDGSSIISPFLKGDARMAYYRVQQYAMPILIALLWLLPSILRFDPLGIYLNATAGRLYSILLGV